jgi:hypothetical protein
MGRQLVDGVPHALGFSSAKIMLSWKISSDGATS